jgi:hypothetical protein
MPFTSNRLKEGIAREKVQVLADSRAASLSAASSLSTTSTAVTVDDI